MMGVEEGIIWNPDEIDELYPESMNTSRMNGDGRIMIKWERERL